MIAVRVLCAFGIVGWRNNGTPLLTASMPVMAVHPLANAVSRTHPPTAAELCRIGGGAITGSG